MDLTDISTFRNFTYMVHNSCIKQITLVRDTERKGKPVEKQGRKATGLKLKSHDSRVAEHL